MIKTIATKVIAVSTHHHLDPLDLEDQQQYFRVCIEPNLYDNISSPIDARMPIFGAGGCIDILTQEFTLIYPLSTQRTSYFRLEQDKEEAFSSFTLEKDRKLGRPPKYASGGTAHL